MQNNQTRYQIGDNLNLFDWTYIKNAADSHILAAEALCSEKDQGAAGQIFNITNGEPTYFWDMCRAVWAHYGDVKYPSGIWNIPKSLAFAIGYITEMIAKLRGKECTGLTRQRVVYACVDRYYCIDKARDVLGYAPEVSLVDGLARTLKWYDENS